MEKKKFIITIARQFGSMGRPIAKRMSEKLGIEFYGRDIVEEAAKKLNILLWDRGYLESMLEDPDGKRT